MADKKRPDAGSRIGFGDATPAPRPDLSWNVPGAVPPTKGKS